MALVQINEGYHTRKMKDDASALFQAKKISPAFYVLKSVKGEYWGRHLVKVVDELSEAVSADNR